VSQISSESAGDGRLRWDLVWRGRGGQWGFTTFICFLFTRIVSCAALKVFQSAEVTVVFGEVIHAGAAISRRYKQFDCIIRHISCTITALSNASLMLTKTFV
jgi:hypothetical protein